MILFYDKWHLIVQRCATRARVYAISTGIWKGRCCPQGVHIRKLSWNEYGSCSSSTSYLRLFMVQKDGDKRVLTSASTSDFDAVKLKDRVCLYRMYVTRVWSSTFGNFCLIQTCDRLHWLHEWRQLARNGSCNTHMLTYEHHRICESYCDSVAIQFLFGHFGRN